MTANSRLITVLHIEDDELQRLLVERLLRSMSEYSFLINWAAGEDEAIEKAQACSESLGLVLLDQHLSQGNGLACLQRLRSINPYAPIMALTTVSWADSPNEFLAAGADRYINKHKFQPKEFLEQVRDLLRQTPVLKA